MLDQHHARLRQVEVGSVLYILNVLTSILRVLESQNHVIIEAEAPPLCHIHVWLP